MMRIVLHTPYQMKLAEKFPAMFQFPPLDPSVGIPHMKTAQETKFLECYDLNGGEEAVVRAIVQTGTEMQRTGESPVLMMHRKLLERFMGEYLLRRLPEWNEEGSKEASNLLRRDIIHSYIQHLGETYWNSVGTFSMASNLLIAGSKMNLALRKSVRVEFFTLAVRLSGIID